MKTFEEWREVYPVFQIIASLVVLILYLILRKVFSSIVRRRAILHNFDSVRAAYIKRAVRGGVAFFFIIILGLVWEISLRGLSLYMASFVTIIGVGLVATWSVVSNITSSVILFFFFPFKIGSKVKIVDGENSAEGEVIGVSLFSIRIRKENGNDLYYPNNMAIQKSIEHIKG